MVLIFHLLITFFTEYIHMHIFTAWTTVAGRGFYTKSMAASKIVPHPPTITSSWTPTGPRRGPGHEGGVPALNPAPFRPQLLRVMEQQSPQPIPPPQHLMLTMMWSTLRPHRLLTSLSFPPPLRPLPSPSPRHLRRLPPRKHVKTLSTAEATRARGCSFMANKRRGIPQLDGGNTSVSTYGASLSISSPIPSSPQPSGPPPPSLPSLPSPSPRHHHHRRRFLSCRLFHNRLCRRSSLYLLSSQPNLKATNTLFFKYFPTCKMSIIK
jgi:hypothetical protein